MIRQMIELETFQSVDKISVQYPDFSRMATRQNSQVHFNLVVHSKFLLFYLTLLQVLYLSFFKITTLHK